MNKLIKELADEAGFVMWNDEEHAPIDGIVDWSCSYDFELEKFAELIIHNCIKELAILGISNSDNEDIRWTAEKAIWKIKKKFDKE
jgi:hypothetical protein